MTARPSLASTFSPPPSAVAVHRLALILGVWLALMVGFARPAAAQPVAGDPPGRVARLADLSGGAWYYHPDNGDWAEAVRNQPLTTGDRLATDPNSRAELQIGSTTLRLDGGSDLEVVALDDAHISLQLHAGVLAARVRNAAEAGQVDVATDDGRFLLLRAGSYRFDRGSRSSFVMVEAGEVRYEYATSALNVGPGQRGEFWVDAAGAAQYALLGVVADAFTAWNAERDRAADRSIATRYVSPEMTGVEDLDRYGTWEQTPDYGAVWFPTAVAVDWAPYSAGRWAWVRPWGWTWVDDAPWGFAPFHYGRWVNVRNRWCWTPGVRQPRPVWAPALVGWVGGGPPVGGPRGGGGPAVGWFPLAPREVYLPGYASTPRYVRSINQTNVPNQALVNAAINDPRSARDFENRRFPHAVTVVPATVLIERRPVGPAVTQFRDAPWARDFAQRSGPGAVSFAPPVAPPNLPPPGDARRPPRPPPGFAEFRGGGRRDGNLAERDAQRPAGPAPVGAADSRFPPQRGERDRDRDGQPDRSNPPFGGRPQGNAPAGQPAVPQTQPQAATPPAIPAPGAGRGMPPPGFPSRGPQPGAPESRPAVEAPPQQPRPVDVQESPRMRVLPVHRGEDRRIGEGAGPPTAPAARPELAPPVRPQVIPPAPSIAPVRPIEAPRMPERVAPSPTPPIQPVRPEVVVPRAPEPQSPRLTPPRAPEFQPRVPEAQPARPAPARSPELVTAPRPVEAPRPAPAESPRVGAPERRNDPGAAR